MIKENIRILSSFTEIYQPTEHSYYYRLQQLIKTASNFLQDPLGIKGFSVPRSSKCNLLKQGHRVHRDELSGPAKQGPVPSEMHSGYYFILVYDLEGISRIGRQKIKPLSHHLLALLMADGIILFTNNDLLNSRELHKAKRNLFLFNLPPVFLLSSTQKYKTINHVRSKMSE